MPVDLSHVKVLIVIFAMPGCPACDDYLPRFMKQVEEFQKYGHPFLVHNKNAPIPLRSIPIIIYDATSKDAEIQDFANRFDVKGLPATIFLPRIGGYHKLEGAQDDQTIYNLLATSLMANR